MEAVRNEIEITGGDVLSLLELLLNKFETMSPMKDESIEQFSKRKDETRDLVVKFSEASNTMVEAQVFFKVI